MSMSISTWKTKELSDLVIPLKEFYVHERTDWHPSQPKITNAETMEVELECGCSQTIKGNLIDGNLHVTSFDMTGEGSGTFMNYVFEPALKRSTGTLKVVTIWEDDSIWRTEVIEGVLTETEIEI